MPILVTGSAGHLGEAIVRTLRERGQPVRGIDLKASPYTDRVGSIRHRDFVRDCMRDVGTVFHTAALHKPHVATHSVQDFIDTNVSGTLSLLEAAAAANVERFVFTSTTSAFGAALTPGPGEPAAWVTEKVVPVPRNIYGVSKVMAENLCELISRKRSLPVVILRTSRFFPEADDDARVRAMFDTANTQANELLHRRLDIEDAVGAHLLAADKAPGIGFARYTISATSPFRREDLARLRKDAAGIVRDLFPDADALYAAKGWRLFAEIDRVYVNRLARQDRDFRSKLARDVGSKSYHETVCEEVPYPVAARPRIEV